MPADGAFLFLLHIYPEITTPMMPAIVAGTPIPSPTPRLIFSLSERPGEGPAVEFEVAAGVGMAVKVAFDLGGLKEARFEAASVTPLARAQIQHQQLSFLKF